VAGVVAENVTGFVIHARSAGHDEPLDLPWHQMRWVALDYVVGLLTTPMGAESLYAQRRRIRHALIRDTGVAD